MTRDEHDAYLDGRAQGQRDRQGEIDRLLAGMQDIIQGNDNFVAEITRLRKQNAELLAALKDIRTEIPAGTSGWQGVCFETIDELVDAAIAAAEDRHD
jgi:hypothetical protein